MNDIFFPINTFGKRGFSNVQKEKKEKNLERT